MTPHEARWLLAMDGVAAVESRSAGEVIIWLGGQHQIGDVSGVVVKGEVPFDRVAATVEKRIA